MSHDTYILRGFKSWVGKLYKVSRKRRGYCSDETSEESTDIGAACSCEKERDLLEKDVSMSHGRALKKRQGQFGSPFMSSSNLEQISTSSADPDDTIGRVDTTTTEYRPEFTTTIESGVMSSVATLDTGAQSTQTEPYIFTATTGPYNSDGSPTTVTPAPSDSALANPTAGPGLGLAVPASTSTSSGGLSQGSKVGLGVGLGVGLSLLLAAVVFYCLARRGKRKDTPTGGAQNTPHGQSDLSIIEQSQPIQIKAEQSQPAERQRLPAQAEYREQRRNIRHSQAYHAIPQPPGGVFAAREGQSPVTPIEPETRGRDAAGIPLSLTIPGSGRPSGVSREASRVRSHSPVSPLSPVSPFSAVLPATSNPPSRG